MPLWSPAAGVRLKQMRFKFTAVMEFQDDNNDEMMMKHL